MKLETGTSADAFIRNILSSRNLLLFQEPIKTYINESTESNSKLTLASVILSSVEQCWFTSNEGLHIASWNISLGIKQANLQICK